MSVALIELVEMTATLNVVVSINSTTVMQTYWTAPCIYVNGLRLRQDQPESPLKKSLSLLFYPYLVLLYSKTIEKEH